MPTTPQPLPGKPTSLWIDTTPPTHFPPLPDGLSVDVAIVGAGIAGITAATFLAEAGLKIALIEAGRIVQGVTGYTTAKLTSQHTLIYQHLLKSFGEEKAYLYAGSNQWAITHIKKWSEEKKITCDYLSDRAYTYTRKKEQLGDIKKEVKAAQQLGLPASFTTELDLPYPVAGAILFEDQARFHPRKYLLGLVEGLKKKKVLIFEQSRVQEIEEKERQVVISTPTATLKAKQVLVTTHFPIYDKSFFFTRLTPYRSYVLAVEVEGKLPQGMFIDLNHPYPSLRRQPYENGELLLIGADMHKTGQGGDTSQHYRHAEAWGEKHFKIKSIKYRWSTQDNATPDKVPYIGKATPTTKRVFLATGFDGWGMTNGTVAGKLLADLVLERDNPWARLYDPNRFKMTGTKTLLKENTNTVKHFITDRFAGAKLNVSKIKNGEGKLLRAGKEQVGVYRDEHGKLYAVSPVCTHMGCIVQWNSAEKSWDCPCHGSRFRYDGAVLHGPAVKELERRTV